MVKRVGFAATLAAALIFSSLLISAFVITYGSGQRLYLDEQANEANAHSAEARVTAAVLGLSLLSRVEEVASTNQFPCTGLAGSISEKVGEVNASATYGTLVATGSISVADRETIDESDPMLFPFNGTRAGALNTSLALHIHSEVSFMGVSYSRVEGWTANLPIDLDTIQEVCSRWLGILQAAAPTLASVDCNTSSLAANLAVFNQTLVQEARIVGLESRLTLTFHPGTSCATGLLLGIAQESIQGPSGNFDFSAVEAVPLGPQS